MAMPWMAQVAVEIEAHPGGAWAVVVHGRRAGGAGRAQRGAHGCSTSTCPMCCACFGSQQGGRKAHAGEGRRAQGQAGQGLRVPMGQGIANQEVRQQGRAIATLHDSRQACARGVV